MIDPAFVQISLFLAAFVLKPLHAAIAAAIVVVAVILVWKLAKLAVKIAVIAGAIFLLYFVARNAGWL